MIQWALEFQSLDTYVESKKNWIFYFIIFYNLLYFFKNSVKIKRNTIISGAEINKTIQFSRNTIINKV